MRCLFACTLLLTLSGLAFAGSETPPDGPSWERDLIVAHQKALKQGVPLFVYFTKTY